MSHAATVPARYSGPETGDAALRWKLPTRIAFRFFACFFALFCWPSTHYPQLADGDPVPILWHHAIPWLTQQVLGHRISVMSISGDGDSAYDYALCILLMILAGLATVVWSVLDRERPHYGTLYRWARFYVGVCLATQMFAYGFDKVVPSQMLPPSLSRLSMRAGDMSLMALLWFFMSSTRVYQTFAGLVEVMGGVLLFVPRFSPLGGLISAAAMTNVLIMDISYNVGVRVFSAELLMMAVFVCAPVLPRLCDLLILQRAVPATPPEPFFKRRFLNRVILGVAAAYGIFLAVYDPLVDPDGLPRARRAYDLVHVVPFYGIWNVDEFAIDDNVRAPLLTDNERWNEVIFDFFDGNFCCDSSDTGLTIMSAQLERRMYWMQFDAAASQIKLFRFDRGQGLSRPLDIAPETILAAERKDSDHLVLSGNMNRHHIRAAIRRIEPDFRLRRRGFEWIKTMPAPIETDHDW